MRTIWTRKRFNFNKHRLAFWVLMQGGINYQREYLKGECDMIRENSIGCFLVNKNNTGKTLDELTINAIEDGFLSEEQSLSDFLESLFEDLAANYSRSKKQYSKYASFDGMEVLCQ